MWTLHSVDNNISMHIYILICKHAYIYIYVCICACCCRFIFHALQPFNFCTQLPATSLVPCRIADAEICSALTPLLWQTTNHNFAANTCAYIYKRSAAAHIYLYFGEFLIWAPRPMLGVSVSAVSCHICRHTRRSATEKLQ